jgi:hypothetical protein
MSEKIMKGPIDEIGKRLYIALATVYDIGYSDCKSGKKPLVKFGD